MEVNKFSFINSIISLLLFNFRRLSPSLLLGAIDVFQDEPEKYSDRVAFFNLAFYMFVIIVITLNMIVAFMSSTYNKVSEFSRELHAIDNAEIVLDYDYSTKEMPPPWNIFIFLVHGIGRVILFFLRKYEEIDCCFRKNHDLSSTYYSARRILREKFEEFEQKRGSVVERGIPLDHLPEWRCKHCEKLNRQEHCTAAGIKATIKIFIDKCQIDIPSNIALTGSGETLKGLFKNFPVLCFYCYRIKSEIPRDLYVRQKAGFLLFYHFYFLPVRFLVVIFLSLDPIIRILYSFGNKIASWSFRKIFADIEVGKSENYHFSLDMMENQPELLAARLDKDSRPPPPIPPHYVGVMNGSIDFSEARKMRRSKTTNTTTGNF